MNKFFEGLKNQIRSFCLSAHGFKIFLLASIKTLTNLDILQEAATETPPPPYPNKTGGNSKETVDLNIL